MTKGQGHKVNSQGQMCNYLKKNWDINHEQMIESWSNLNIGLTSMQHWSWPKIKVTRSKVKVKYAIVWKKCLGYLLWTNDCILITLMLRTHINASLKVAQDQGQRSRSNMQLCENNVWSINHKRMIASWLNIYLGFISMQRWRWHKFKVTRSKVKVKCATTRKSVFAINHNVWLDLDQNCTRDSFRWNFESDVM